MLGMIFSLGGIFAYVVYREAMKTPPLPPRPSPQPSAISSQPAARADPEKLDSSG